jgi:hypothetical protein
MKPAVSGLKNEFPGKVTPHNVDATLPEAKESIKALGFKSHGLVIRSTDGTVLWKQADHSVRIESVRGALREILST